MARLHFREEIYMPALSIIYKGAFSLYMHFLGGGGGVFPGISFFPEYRCFEKSLELQLGKKSGVTLNHRVANFERDIIYPCIFRMPQKAQNPQNLPNDNFA